MFLILVSCQSKSTEHSNGLSGFSYWISLDDITSKMNETQYNNKNFKQLHIDEVRRLINEEKECIRLLCLDWETLEYGGALPEPEFLSVWFLEYRSGVQMLALKVTSDSQVISIKKDIDRSKIYWANFLHYYMDRRMNIPVVPIVNDKSQNLLKFRLYDCNMDLEQSLTLDEPVHRYSPNKLGDLTELKELSNNEKMYVSEMAKDLVSYILDVKLNYLR